MQAAAMAGHLPVMLHLAGAGVSWACHPSPLEMYLNRQNNTQHLGAQHQQQMVSASTNNSPTHTNKSAGNWIGRSSEMLRISTPRDFVVAQ